MAQKMAKKTKEDVKAEVMKKLARADELERTQKGSKAAQKARRAACEALLWGLREGVEFDTEDPLFQNFHKKTWQRTMERLCKKVKHWYTKLAHGLWDVVNNVPIPINVVPQGILKILGAEVVKESGILDIPQEFNEDVWDNFLDSIPEKKQDRQLSTENSVKQVKGNLKNKNHSLLSTVERLDKTSSNLVQQVRSSKINVA